MFNYNEKVIPAFDDVKFKNLIISWSYHDTNPKLKTPEIKRVMGDSRKPSYIQLWLNFSNNKDGYVSSLNIVPTLELINWIESNMLTIEYDRIYFEIIQFDDYFDLYARYNQIIGSRLLGRFSNSELPTVKEES